MNIVFMLVMCSALTLQNAKKLAEGGGWRS